MELYYEGSDGTIIDFMSNGIYAQNPESLNDSKWEYNSIAAINNKEKIKSFYKGIHENKLNLSIIADTEEEFNEKMYQMHRVFEKDIRRLTPGKIWWNGFYKEGFVFESSNDEFDEFLESVEKSISFVTPYDFWMQKKLFQFQSQNIVQGAFDYDGYDYSFDYDQSELIDILNNKSIDSSNFRIIFYGPAEELSVFIGGHEYSLDCALEDGEYAVIDSLTKKIRKFDIYGEEENIFYTRDRDSYVFEKIPEGLNSVIRAKSMKVDIEIIDERGEAEWI